MDTQQAHDVLGTKPGDSTDALQRVYKRRHAELEKQIAEAPTPTLKDRRRKALHEIEEAWSVLGASATPPAPVASGLIGVGEFMTGSTPGSNPVPDSPPVHHAVTSALHGTDTIKTLKEKLKSMPPWAPAGIVVAGVTVLLIVVISLISHGDGAAPHGGGLHGGGLHGGGLHGGGGAVAEPKAASAPANVATPPTSVPELLKQATDKYIAGDNQAAITIYRKILEIEPAHTMAMDQLNKLAPTRGRVHVVTKPSGGLAEVVAAGKKPTGVGEKVSAANSGAMFDDLPFGAYTVHVHLPGFEPLEPVAVQLNGSLTQEVQLEMKRQTGTLALTSDPGGQEFTVRLLKTPAADKDFEPFEKKGKTSQELTQLPTGKYAVEFATGKREVEITPGGKVEIAIVGSGAPTVALAGGTPVGAGASTPTTAPSAASSVPAAGGQAQYTAGTPSSVPPPPPGSAQVQVTTDKPAYRSGEAVTCSVQIPFDGHLRLYSIDATKNATQVFPNQFEPNDQVHAGQTVRIPGNGTYDLKLELPPGLTNGTEAVHAVLSPTPFGDDAKADYSQGSFQVLGQMNAGQLQTRGLKPQQKTATAVGEASYQITP